MMDGNIKRPRSVFARRNFHRLFRSRTVLHIFFIVGDLKAFGAGAEWFQGLHGYCVAFSPPTIRPNDWNASPEARVDALDEPS